MAELCHVNKRPKSGIDRRAQAFQSQLGEDAIFSNERHGVGDGGNRHDLHERIQQTSAAGFRNSALDKSLGQFEGNARAAQRLAWILATRLIGIHHGQRRRNALRTREDDDR